MGREVRRVPAGWQHPKRPNGHFDSLMGGGYASRLREWERGREQWALGLRRNYGSGGKRWVRVEEGDARHTWAEWDGERPVASDYMPEWPEGEATHFMMYETTSEGSPISPAFATPEELARWLADTGASSFAGRGASYEGWLRVCRGGFAPSMVAIVPERGAGAAFSGVDGLTGEA